MRQRARIVLRVRRDLGESDVSGRVDEVAELAVGHRRLVDPERVDADAVRGRFLRIVPVRSHAKDAAGDTRHAPRVSEEEECFAIVSDMGFTPGFCRGGKRKNYTPGVFLRFAW